MESMRDWTLANIVFDWKNATVIVALRSAAGPCQLVADGVIDLKVPKVHDWRPSSSINGTSEAKSESGTTTHLKIEMQTGDVIEIVAQSLSLE